MEARPLDQHRWEIVRRWERRRLEELLPTLPRKLETIVFPRFLENVANHKQWSFSAETWKDSTGLEQDLMVAFEAERWMPYPIRDTYQSWRPLRHSSEAEEITLDIRHLPAELLIPLLSPLDGHFENELRIAPCEATARQDLLGREEQSNEAESIRSRFGVELRAEEFTLFGCLLTQDDSWWLKPVSSLFAESERLSDG